jgi:hypothetical protein
MQTGKRNTELALSKTNVNEVRGMMCSDYHQASSGKIIFEDLETHVTTRTGKLFAPTSNW